MPVLIKVRSRTNQQGLAIPVLCIIDGERYQVLGVGRRWQADDGEHIMVMFPGDRAVELLHRPDGSWLLVKDHSALKDQLI